MKVDDFNSPQKDELLEEDGEAQITIDLRRTNVSNS